MTLAEATDAGRRGGSGGATALNAATYLGMVLRARPSSDIPEQVVEKQSQRAGAGIVGKGEERQNRLHGVGALSGAGHRRIYRGTCRGIAACGNPARTGAGRPVLLGGAAMAVYLRATAPPVSRRSRPRATPGSRVARALRPSASRPGQRPPRRRPASPSPAITARDSGDQSGGPLSATSRPAGNLPWAGHVGCR